MKKLYILGFASLLSTAIMAQHTTKLARINAVEKNSPKLRSAGAGRTVTGNIVCNTNYVAGTTMDLNFTITQTNTDFEDIDSLAITFPAGFTVNSSPSDPFPTADATGGAEALNGVSGQTISWGSNVGNTDTYGGIDATTPQVFTINVTISPILVGTQTLTFFAKGDEFPSTDTPPGTNGDLAGTISVMQATSADVQAIEAYIPSGCSLGNELVQFVLKNNGTLPATGFDVRYIANGGTPVVETYTGTVNAGDTVLYTFITPLNMSAAGLYNLKAITTITADGNINNDTTMYVGQSIAPAAIPYTTGFETTPATDLLGWSVLDADNSGATFGISPSAHTGSQSLWAFENNVDGASNDWAFSTCIDFTAATNYRIVYWKRLTTGYEGSLGISLGSMTTVAGMTQTISPLTPLTANSTWAKDSADFTVATTGTYYVGLNAANTNVANSLSIRIDDVNIKVVPTSVGINELTSAAVSVYPNPSTGVFTIDLGSMAKASVEVYNIVGSKVIAKEFNSQSSTLDMSGFDAGIYFIKVATNNGQVTKKVTITK